MDGREIDVVDSALALLLARGTVTIDRLGVIRMKDRPKIVSRDN